MDEMTRDNSDFRQSALDHLDSLFGFAIVLTHNQTEAEDLVQETYLRAMRAFGQLAPDSNLKSWLFTIMRNVWRNQLRHKRSGPQFIELDTDDGDDVEHARWLDTLAQNPHMVFQRKIEREEVRAAIKRLPPHYREVVVLRDLEGFSYQQIATILECPAGTVMSRLSRAREQLRFFLSEWRTIVAPQ